MLKTFLQIPILALLMCPHAFSCAKVFGVEERNGNIYFRDDKIGKVRQVTDSRKDHSPALSCDGSLIIFVRDLVGDRDYNDFLTATSGKRVMQLWTADARGNQPVQLILDSPIEIRGHKFSGFYTPQFSSSNDQIYFMIQFGASSRAVVRLTVPNHELTYVTDALEFAVIPTGEYKDDLVVRQHRSKLGIGYYDWYYVLKPNGQEVGVVGENKEDVYNFVVTYAGEVNLCPNWNTEAWITCINQIR